MLNSYKSAIQKIINQRFFLSDLNQTTLLAFEAALKPSMESVAGKMLVQLNKALTDKLMLKFRTVHALAKHCRPFTDYTWQCSLDEIKVD